MESSFCRFQTAHVAPMPSPDVRMIRAAPGNKPVSVALPAREHHSVGRQTAVAVAWGVLPVGLYQEQPQVE